MNDRQTMYASNQAVICDSDVDSDPGEKDRLSNKEFEV